MVAAQVRWDPAPASPRHHFPGPARAVLGSCADLLPEHRALASRVSALFVSWELPASILIALTLHRPLQIRNYSSEFFIHFFQMNVGFFFFFSPFLPSLSSLPLFFLSFFSPQCWLTFTRTQCDLVTLGILCTLICQFGKLICGRMSRSQRSGSWSADLLTG